MSIQKLNSSPKREPLSRLWFIARGCKQADLKYTNGHVIWLHPETNDALNRYGNRLKLRILPKEKFFVTSARYLYFSREHGDMSLARLKYLTFIGPIPEGFTIDHIDGNTFNNNINNLRAIPDAINRRDGGFIRKLRNNGITISMYPGIILEGYERMAVFKETHKEWQYRELKGDDLLQVFLGPHFVVSDPLAAAAKEPNRDFDPFVERN